MDVPFHRVKRCGSILVAARGASIHTFRIVDGSHASTWNLEQQRQKELEGGAGEAGQESSSSGNGNGNGCHETPPPKRRRLESAAVVGRVAGIEAAPIKTAESRESSHVQEQRKKRADAAVIAALRSGDLPVVSILEVAADGRHVVVVMGHDKTIRVLAPDVCGRLEQISARAVPKRPCAVAITADGQTILVGDKFGDVYALPLVETDETRAAVTAAVAADAEQREALDPKAAASTPLQLQANSFTVHTKGNLQALENQRRQKEREEEQKKQKEQQDMQNSKQKKKSKSLPESGAAAADPSCRLLLGHVSMLTAVAVAEAIVPSSSSHNNNNNKRSRPLILTADRDEHIRVTRGTLGSLFQIPPTPQAYQAPQTHVIETFCLGHTSFVSRMCVAARRPDRLISGGGDGQLRVWNFWPAGHMVGSVALGPLVERVLPTTDVREEDGQASAEEKTGETATKVTVSGLYTFPSSRSSDTSAIVVVCERVPALFFLELQADGCTLTHVQTLALPGLPLDVAVVEGTGASSEAARLVVAMAALDDDQKRDDTSPLVVVSEKSSPQDDGLSWVVTEEKLTVATQQGSQPKDTDVDPAVLRQLLLYGTESLRKTADEGGEP